LVNVLSRNTGPRYLQVNDLTLLVFHDGCGISKWSVLVVLRFDVEELENLAILLGGGTD
jgi:hypothetical protein